MTFAPSKRYHARLYHFAMFREWQHAKSRRCAVNDAPRRGAPHVLRARNIMDSRFHWRIAFILHTDQRYKAIHEYCHYWLDFAHSRECRKASYSLFTTMRLPSRRRDVSYSRRNAYFSTTSSEILRALRMQKKCYRRRDVLIWRIILPSPTVEASAMRRIFIQCLPSMLAATPQSMMRQALPRASASRYISAFNVIDFLLSQMKYQWY